MKKLFGYLTILLSLCFAFPLVPNAQAAPAQAASTSEIQGKVNVNAASAKELQALPGIGRVTAQRIIDYRTAKGPFTAVEDLLKVNGIGESTLQKIGDLIVLE
ncbi:MAG: ComEA family DNA-binding protein [Syntrophotaleaceae bacterium]